MEIVGGWGFQQSRWLASRSQDVLELSFQQRDRLRRVLIELDLIEPCRPAFARELLRQVSSDCVALWSQAAFLEIAKAISEYWALLNE